MGPAEQRERDEGESTSFRAAFGRARIEALTAVVPAPAVPDTPPVESPCFEYRLVRRRGKRSAEERRWNEFGAAGWELVGVTGRHAAFKRVRALSR